jgi:1,4-alpha-glucan branching enzyme
MARRLCACRKGGLGFGFKWNLGWMHDTLDYLKLPGPAVRRYHHNELTFGLLYAFTENFILPLSHDEVVYGKRCPRAFPGDEWQQFATLRAYYAFMWAFPGKKLLFMGHEIGQIREWSHDREVDWHLLNDPLHAGLQKLVRDLNRLYTTEPSLHRRDSDSAGFAWIIGNDADNSVFAFERRAEHAPPVLAVVNMTPVPRASYRIGVGHAGAWREILNTDSQLYGGSNVGNGGRIWTRRYVASHGQTQSLELALPPLAAVFLRPET